jgi:succinate dehydrogenase hydrophobic anchor subunit
MTTPTKSRTVPLTKRGLNFEMLMWIFTRLSALAMYALILFAIIGALIMGARTQMNLADVLRWGFMPNVTHVRNTNVQDITPWASPFWKTVASLLLMVATAHGVHGLVVICDDYIVKPLGRQIVRYISIVFIVAMIVIGIYVIWTS